MGTVHAIIAPMTDSEIRRVLEFWFASAAQDSPHIDARMNRWFGTDPELDRQIGEEFGELMDAAAAGELDDWADTPEGRLALIILLDQFPRNARRGTPAAFAGDRQALKLCVEGTMNNCYKALPPMQQLFFFMPLQHAESLKIQDKSTAIYRALAERVSPTLRETFETAAQFAELHRDIVAEFGRFPHRNAVLGRPDTPAEAEYLTADAPSFGQ
jgi:uncharacterized protein (DUF924 family)